jgi:hypothetical protein
MFPVHHENRELAHDRASNLTVGTSGQYACVGLGESWPKRRQELAVSAMVISRWTSLGWWASRLQAYNNPIQFVEYLAYCHSLKFEAKAKPNIAYHRGMFRDLFQSQGYTNNHPSLNWDWNWH